MKKIAIINRGIPLSGKSTFAKEIKNTLLNDGYDAKICSTDNYFMVDGEYKFDSSLLAKYHALNQEDFKKALKDGVDVVICDNTNIEPWEANPYCEMANDNGYYVLILSFEPKELQEHIKLQNSSNYNKTIPTNVLEKMLRLFESCDEDEFFFDELIQIVPVEFLNIKDIIGGLILNKLQEPSENEIKLIPEHYRVIMQELERKKIITAYEIKDRLGKSTKQVERYLKDLIAGHTYYGKLLTTVLSFFDTLLYLHMYFALVLIHSQQNCCC